MKLTVTQDQWSAIGEAMGWVKIAGKRDDIKASGSFKIPMPVDSDYIAVHVFEYGASELYGAGTQWCTTGEYGENEFESFPNLIYFIHKSLRIEDDPALYKLALQIECRARPVRYYTYDAQNMPVRQDEFLELVGVDNIEYFKDQLDTIWAEKIDNGYFDDVDDYDAESEPESEFKDDQMLINFASTKLTITHSQWSDIGKTAGWIEEIERKYKTFNEIREKYDKQGKNHCLKLECAICGNIHTCRCRKKKILVKGICHKCEDPGL